jgi:hypothetical protein
VVDVHRLRRNIEALDLPDEDMKRLSDNVDSLEARARRARELVDVSA